MDDKGFIQIKGARVNNLKNISVSIPRNKLVVITGVSGSGKSSLAFDTLYAEGQRRYVESLSAYARQFLGRMSKPECDFITGLPPAIAIEQKVISRNPRSTVGTSTEIYEYLRLLFARIGKTYSPVSNQEVKKHTADDVVQCMLSFSKGTKFMLLAPLCIAEGRTLQQQLETEVLQGYSRIYYKEDVMRIDDFLEQHHDFSNGKEEIHLLIDRMSADDTQEAISRLTDSAETAFYEGQGICRLVFLPSNLTYNFSTRFEADGLTFEEPTDQLFAFNSPIGMCPTCEGFGKVMGIDENLVIPDQTLSVYDGCVQCWHGDKMGMWQKEFIRRAAKYSFPIFKPYNELSNKEKDRLWHGFPADKMTEKVCIDEFFRMVKENQYKIQYRVMLARYRGKTICPDCHGGRLRKEANYVKINGKSISDLVRMPITDLADWFKNVTLDQHSEKIAGRLLAEINSRLQYILDVGLGYLTLDRPSNTLSGGESQRINLTTSLGSSLVGSLYILDEPSIGLHTHDTWKLINVLKKLRDLGNTVVVVEHDEEIMRAADHIIDVGPDAGVNGGEIVAEFSPKEEAGELEALKVKSHKKSKEKSNSEAKERSHTLRYLSGTDTIATPKSRRQWNSSIQIKGASMNNLKSISVTFPLHVLTVVTGVSGSGKSSLVRGTLYPIIKRHLGEVADTPGAYSNVSGDLNKITHVEFIDQNPIAKQSRSNPATYSKAYDAIRELFAMQPLAAQLGITARHFSFNTDGGRCEECHGAGTTTVEMQFMADLTLTCEACHGRRFKNDVLQVTYQGKNILNVLSMTVAQAIEFFQQEEQKETSRATRNQIGSIIERLKPLADVGLGYIQLGQSTSTLSGGESQRLKLATHLFSHNQNSKSGTTLFIFDEPTTGLHPHDIRTLLCAFDRLIACGHTIIVVEHNMDVIRTADHIIDLGPGAGVAGGEITACGTPEQVAACPESITGKYLQKTL